jgi:hypothetical protein
MAISSEIRYGERALTVFCTLEAVIVEKLG